MKKNAVGRVLAYKEPVGRRISALHIPARLLCLLLALIIWLAVVNLKSAPKDTHSDTDADTQAEETV